MADKRKKQRKTSPNRGGPSSNTEGGQHSASDGRSCFVAEAPAPPWLRLLTIVAASYYLFGLLFDGLQPKTTQHLFPPAARFFVQATCLFPHAARMAIDYRLEGWDCAASSFQELDPSFYFPIRPNDKESRFQRVAHFHRRNRPVMEELERYVLEKEQVVHPNAHLGGIRVSSLRMVLPEPGTSVPRWVRPAMNDHPSGLVKHWFYTPVSRRELNCRSKGHPRDVQAGSPQ